ncbi:MAG TPA: arginase family protein [Acidimicrobiia bacterium]|nr:arginase family protein [Acidimicrobiia bacterium]
MTIVDPYRAGVWLAREDPEPEVVVVGVPNSKSSSTRADLAPLEMRNRLDRFSTYHSELEADLGSVRVRDMGNWPISGYDPESLVEELPRWTAKLSDAPLRIFLGGDNAITRPLVAARATDLTGLITFDAHQDVGTLEDGPSNSNPVRGLIEEDGLGGHNIVRIGIHSFFNPVSDHRFCDDAGVTTVTVAQVEDSGIKATVDAGLDRLSSSCDQIYVNVDVGVLDSAFAPACPGARPGGLTVRQLATGVARCAAHPTVSAVGFVGVDPGADTGHQTVDVLAHLFLSTVAGYARRGV